MQQDKWRAITVLTFDLAAVVGELIATGSGVDWALFGTSSLT